MSDGTLASAVAVPDQGDIQQSQDPIYKRRNSSVTDRNSKRRRLSADGDASPQSQRQQPSQSPTSERERKREIPAERKPGQRGGRDDERKRGQRLFGGLLGTLSQSSTSAAQRRRADIEKRQQDKLKNQAEEFDGLQSRRKERRDAIRKKEMPFYEREAMQRRHSNMIAAAHFLKTRTQPVLFYKPWQLQRRDEIVIAEQIKEAEAIISREVAEFESRYPVKAFEYQPEPELKNEQPAGQQEEQQKPQQQHQNPLNGEQKETTGSSTEDPTGSSTEDHPPVVDRENPTEKSSGDTAEAQNTSDPNKSDAPNEETIAREVAEANRAADDDGGEVVEDNEDTVIY